MRFRPRFAVAAATVVATSVVLSWSTITAYLRSRKRKQLIGKLPDTLLAWRAPESEDDAYQMWLDLVTVFKDAGLTPWKNDHIGSQRTPDGSDVFPNGYLYATNARQEGSGPGKVAHLRLFWISNRSSHVVRTSDGQDAVLRVVAIHDEGHEQLRIWRKLMGVIVFGNCPKTKNLATAPHALMSENHTLPLLQEINLEHVTFAVFPYVAQPMDRIYGGWAKNSVGDILDAVMQALEGLSYIHSLGIAHRDAFTYNFLMQFYPESLLTRVVPVSRPRVYLIDFESAIEFSADCPPSGRKCLGPPCINSLSDVDKYTAPRIPEMDTGEPYDPYTLDVWQLATSLSKFDSTLPAVEEVLDYMASDDPADRLTAHEALTRLRECLEDMPPKSLLIPPIVHYGPGFPSSAELREMCVTRAKSPVVQPEIEA